VEAHAFEPFVERSSPALLRAAWYLTLDEHLAQDLLQTALVRTWRRWPALGDDGDLEAYVKKVMITTASSWRRRRWVGEVPTSTLPDRPDQDVGDGAFDVRKVQRILSKLPPRQRAAVYLRFVEDCSEARTAELLECSVGTVKSQVSRALRALRQASVDNDILVRGDVF